MNLTIIKGRLTADVTMRTANSGTQIAGFTLAVDRRFKDKVSGEKKTDFIRCTAFGKTAEFLGRYTSKGKEILIEGELQQNDYTAQDGHEVKSYQVVVNQVHFCGSKNDSAQYGTTQTEPAQTGLPADVQQFVEQADAVVNSGEVPF
jgi:single-strand DNA-binding protein